MHICCGFTLCATHLPSCLVRRCEVNVQKTTVYHHKSFIKHSQSTPSNSNSNRQLAGENCLLTFTVQQTCSIPCHNGLNVSKKHCIWTGTWYLCHLLSLALLKSMPLKCQWVMPEIMLQHKMTHTAQCRQNKPSFICFFYSVWPVKSCEFPNREFTSYISV